MLAAVLPVGDDVYAIDVGRVSEVLPAAPPTPFPQIIGAFVGAINRRGEVLPLYDTAMLLGGEPTTERLEFHVVVDTRAGRVALGATATPRLARLGEAVGPSERPGTLGLFQPDNVVLTLLDVDALLDNALGLETS